MVHDRDPDTAPVAILGEQEIESDDMLLRVITLNCWGLRYVARDLQKRIKAIAQHLKQQQYDIVFLEELWCQSDFDHIKRETGYRFGHYFKTSSVAGTSGLAIFTKWSPETIHFEPYTVNGSPFKPHHGDWFAGKGVAYVRVDLADLRLHLFCTHMHAQYDDNEQISDPYSIHRICQAYQLSKFINLVAVNSAHSRSGSDLIILAGDLNTSPGELPFNLLMSMTGLVDCAMHRHSHNVNRSLLHGDQDVTIDEDLITCGHHSNTYSVSSASQTRVSNHAGKELTSKPAGKRIDFILYKLAQTCSCEHECCCNIKHSCHGLRDACPGKDPDTGLSFSDHQPVTIKLVIKRESSNRSSLATQSSFSDTCDSGLALSPAPSAPSSRRRVSSTTSDHLDEECLSSKERALKTITSSLNFKNGSIYPPALDPVDQIKLDKVNGFVNRNYDGVIATKQRSHSIGPVLSDDSGTVLGDFEKEDQLMIEQNTTSYDPERYSTLLDILPGRRANSLSANEHATTTTTTILSSTKVHFNPDPTIMPLDEPSLKHLHSMHSLLTDYLNQDRFSKRRFYILAAGTTFLLALGIAVIIITLGLSYAALFHVMFGLLCLTSIMMALIEFTNRMERTAIKGIAEEISSLLSSAPNHLSAKLGSS